VAGADQVSVVDESVAEVALKPRGALGTVDGTAVVDTF
jgi:hypothetical protein